MKQIINVPWNRYKILGINKNKSSYTTNSVDYYRSLYSSYIYQTSLKIQISSDFDLNECK